MCRRQTLASEREPPPMGDERRRLATIGEVDQVVECDDDRFSVAVIMLKMRLQRICPGLIFRYDERQVNGCR